MGSGRAAAPPANAEPLTSGDFGIEQAESGSLAGKLSVMRIQCEDARLLVVETNQGKFFVAITPAGSWDCDQALTQWRGVTPAEALVGVRYLDHNTEGGPSLALINDRGGSQVMRVEGAWRAP